MMQFRGKEMVVYAVEMNDVWVTYDGLWVLEEINLRIEKGRFAGIVGPNGGGKTTLLKIISGLIKPNRGEVTVFGETPERARKFHLVGYLPQKPLLDPRFPITVYDAVLMGRYGKIGIFRRPTKEDRDVVMGNLKRVGIDHLSKMQIGKLSGGQQQRVFIARALSAEPMLLALDEPMISLDACAQDDLYHLVQELKDSLGLTILMVCHDLNVISQFIDDVICLNKRVHLHQPPPIEKIGLERTFGCKVEYLFHGQIPHRVVAEHNE
jgi:zinc transport system ATP-binding protein